MRIDINVDAGESFGKHKIENEEEVLKYATSVNSATNFPANDPQPKCSLALGDGVS
jgi:UPF0271 protein